MATTTANVHPCGTYTYGETEDYSVVIAPRIANDAGVTAIVQPATIAANATTPIEVIVVNYGIDTITSSKGLTVWEIALMNTVL